MDLRGLDECRAVAGAFDESHECGVEQIAFGDDNGEASVVRVRVRGGGGLRNGSADGGHPGHVGLGGGCGFLRAAELVQSG